jgi:hypothetical protein
VVLSGVQEAPRAAMERSGLANEIGADCFAATYRQALAIAERLAQPAK